MKCIKDKCAYCRDDVFKMSCFICELKEWLTGYSCRPRDKEYECCIDEVILEKENILNNLKNYKSVIENEQK